jgi:hypothetical protein
MRIGRNSQQNTFWHGLRSPDSHQNGASSHQKSGFLIMLSCLRGKIASFSHQNVSDSHQCNRALMRIEAVRMRIAEGLVDEARFSYQGGGRFSGVSRRQSRSVETPQSVYPKPYRVPERRGVSTSQVPMCPLQAGKRCATGSRSGTDAPPQAGKRRATGSRPDRNVRGNGEGRRPEVSGPGRVSGNGLGTSLRVRRTGMAFYGMSDGISNGRLGSGTPSQISRATCTALRSLSKVSLARPSSQVIHSAPETSLGSKSAGSPLR